jgi:mono/diheme cytochrome c family protein
MRKMNFFVGSFITFLLVTFVATATENKVAKPAVKMPENVKVIIDKSCFGCHNTDSKNEDAKEELDFKTLDGLTTVKKIGALKHIAEAVEKGEMPPKRFLEKNPDKKLNALEVQILTDWVKKETASLMGK